MAVSIGTSNTTTKFSAPLALAFVLLAAIILQHTPVSTASSYVAILLAYAGASLLLITTYDGTFETNRFYLLIFFIFSIVVGISTLLNVAVGTTARYISLLVVTCISLFVMPKLIPLPYFLAAVSRLSAILVVPGFLPYAGLTIETEVVDLSLWSANMYWYPELEPITSVFVNPNALGFLTLVGAIAAFTELQTNTTRLTALLFGINTIGLFFTNYRTGWVAFVAALGVFIVYSVGGRRLLMISTIFGLSLLSLLLLMMFAIVPGPSALAEMSLNNRRPRWIASVYAIQDQFWWGYGLGNVTDVIQPYTPGPTGNVHNSFLRMFVGSGFIGGLVYLVFYLGAIFSSIRQSVGYTAVVIPSLLIAFLFVQLFNDLTFIGLSLHSVVIALTMGYSFSVNGSSESLDSTGTSRQN